MPMTSATFDTLNFAKRLEQLGFTREQSEGFAQLQREIVDERLATKQDIKDLRAEMREMEYRLTVNITKWVAGMLLAQAGVVAALVKLL
jgi:hypothetical protein